MNRGAWFGILGPLEYRRDGQVVNLPSARQRSLLAVLVVHAGEPLSRDRLIEELWGEQPPSSAVSALHVHISKLRQLLDGLLVRVPAGYVLARDAIEVDLWQFDALVERAHTDPGAPADVLREALALFRGEPLCDVGCEGSLARWRRLLQDRRLQVALSRVDAELAAGGGPDLVAELERLAGEHPMEERVAGQLMLALYRAGRQADALAAYQRLHAHLDSEVGLEPGAELRALQMAILNQDRAQRVAATDLRGPAAPELVTPSAAAGAPPEPDLAPRPLPQLATPTFGRVPGASSCWCSTTSSMSWTAPCLSATCTAHARG